MMDSKHFKFGIPQKILKLIHILMKHTFISSKLFYLGILHLIETNIVS